MLPTIVAFRSILLLLVTHQVPGCMAFLARGPPPPHEEKLKTGWGGGSRARPFLPLVSVCGANNNFMEADEQLKSFTRKLKYGSAVSLQESRI